MSTDKKFNSLCKTFYEASVDQRKAVINMFCHIKETDPHLADQLVDQGAQAPTLNAARIFLTTLLDVHAQ